MQGVIVEAGVVKRTTDYITTTGKVVPLQVAYTVRAGDAELASQELGTIDANFRYIPCDEEHTQAMFTFEVYGQTISSYHYDDIFSLQIGDFRVGVRNCAAISLNNLKNAYCNTERTVYLKGRQAESFDSVYADSVTLPDEVSISEYAECLNECFRIWNTAIVPFAKEHTPRVYDEEFVY